MLKKGEAPAFLFDVDAWLTSVKIAVMTAEQERGYLRLLLYQWKDSQCRLPDDDSLLSVLSKMGEGWFNGGSTLVRSCFVTDIEPGFLVNERLRVEWLRWKAWQAKSIEGGKQSALARKRERSAERKRNQRERDQKRDQKRDMSVTAKNRHAVKAVDTDDGTNEQPRAKHEKENSNGKENNNPLKSTSGRGKSMSSKHDRSMGSPEGVEVFEHWKLVTGHTAAIFGPKRRKAVEARLKEGYSVEQLKLASDGVKRSVFHQGGNDRQAIYDDLELICRDEKHVEQFIAFANGTGNGRSIADQKIDRLRDSHQEFLRRHGVTEDEIRY